MILEMKNISKRFDKLHVLKDISFGVDSGEVVSIITSQNLTRGNRSESAVVTTDPELFATLHAQIQDLITNHSVPLNDLFSRAINAD